MSLKTISPLYFLLAGALLFSCDNKQTGQDAKTKEETNSPAKALSKTDKPNIIILYTDDQGTIDANCYGSKDLYTPAMDKLAETGVRFTRFYAMSPVCSPSRAALLSGKTPQKAGLPDMASSKKGEGGGLPTETLTLAESLKQANYATGLVGKWHLGYTEETMPKAQGFDYSFGHMGGCIDNYSHFFYWHGPNRHDLWRNGQEVWKDGQYFPDLMDEEAKAFIDRNQENPFFLYYAVNMPHYPLQATGKWREYYKDLPSPRKEYAAFLSTIDERIGRLLDYLEDKGLRENTIIVLQSDQGHSTEIRTMGGGGNAGPFRGAKFSVFEGGIRVPAIISWPAGLPKGQVRKQIASNMDWFPTLLDLCGLDNVPTDLEGKSLTAVLKEDAATPHKNLIWKFKSQWAVMQGDYKLMNKPIDPTQGQETFWKPISDSLYLVDLQADPGEQKNILADKPEKARELAKLYQEWLKD